MTNMRYELPRRLYASIDVALTSKLGKDASKISKEQIVTLWLLSLLEPNSWPKISRRIIIKSYFTSNCSSLCLGSCRWCVLRRYNSHPFLSRLLQFCLYQLFPMSDLVTKLFASSCSQKNDTHTMCFTCLCILMKHLWDN